ncbi:DUF1360 domain-containing protein [Actinophytocola glycyrrhizae]|uniref:DUF1360 domain-containing protein n=1 Tax=Actinophytocola glycyrrhizae TaxID=2044873 RepID=A0ABV9S653_9PSEU
MRSLLRQVGERVRKAYADGNDRPLGGYVAVLGTYGSVVGLLSVLARVRGTRLPQRLDAGDTVLLTIATHKASRLLAKDSVTSPLRAPFTRYEEPAGVGELNESVRGTGVRHAAGELVTCPLCLSVWVATGFSAGLVFAPRATRLLLTTLTAIAGSDALHLAYDRAKP